MAQPDNQTKSSDEIDLGALFAKIGDFFRNIGHGFILILATLRNTPLQNKALFSIILVISGALGYTYSSFLKKKFYESSMILSSDYLNKRIVDNAIGKLNLLAGEEGAKGLSDALHISDTLASSIVKFEARPFVAENELIEIEVLKEQLKNAQLKNQTVVDKVVKRIEIENQHAFEFSVRTLNPTVVKPLQDALVKYFKENDYIKKRIQINHEMLTGRKTKLQKESRKLDSLKKIIYSNYKTMSERPQGSNNVILSDKTVTNPIEVFTEDMTLYDQLQAVERGIFLQPDFEVIDGFTEFNQPASAGRLKIILTAILIGFGMSYLIVALRRLDKYLAAFL